MSDITVHLHTADGRVHSIQGRTGRSLMQAAVSSGIEEIAADCGGSLSCATCHVYVDPDWAAQLPPPHSDELQMLDATAAPREATSRLSCQIELQPALQGLRVRVAPVQY